jgi:hypothetical protein
MAKHILLIEDQESRIQKLKGAMDRALEGGALDLDDRYYLVGAHRDADHAHDGIATDPEYQPFYTACKSFRALKEFIQDKHGDRLILLDLDLDGVHGRNASAFDSDNVPNFYAQLTRDGRSRTAIMLYSWGQQTQRKYERIVACDGNPDLISWLDKTPDKPKDADQILLAGLNLYFGKPLEITPIRLELSAFHCIGNRRKGAMTGYFKAISSGGYYPDGTLNWLTSSWLKEVYLP